MEFSRQEGCRGLPFLSPGDLPNPGMEPGSTALQADSLPSEPNPGPKDEAKWANEETQPTVAWLCLHLLPPTKKYIWTGESESDICYGRKLESTLKSKSLANINQMVLWAIIRKNHLHTLHCRPWHTSAKSGQPVVYSLSLLSLDSVVSPERHPSLEERVGDCRMVFKIASGNQFQETFIAHLPCTRRWAAGF